jgi:soluble lytic murein transglycosylase-like protein
MQVGLNKRYSVHLLFCKQWLRKFSKLGSFMILSAGLVLAFPKPNVTVPSGNSTEEAVQEEPFPSSNTSRGLAVRAMEAFLQHHEVRESNRGRAADAIVASARKYNLDPRLIASVMIVESRGNPFAISGKDAIGIMQIHLPTWGSTADREGVNLLKIEDNIDFGARILKNYVREFGLWEGVKRYNGFIAHNPISEQSADEYVAKVQRIYETRQTPRLQAGLVR